MAPKTVTVTAPWTPVLLRKRFNYAQKLAEGQTVATSTKRAALSKDVTVNLPRVAEFFECCAESFFRHKRLAQVFEAVSNGNVRELLRFVRDFVTSRHLDTAKILRNIPDGYAIPEHEAIRALLYGDFVHYDPSSSPFMNMFDITRADPLEHFSRLFALNYLKRINLGPPEDGFCDLETVEQYLCQLGYSGEHTRQTLKFLFERRCCEGKIAGVDAWGDVGDDIRISALGAFHVNDLVGTFAYMDAVVVDTPIVDDDVRRQIKDVQSIRQRLDRAQVFLEYLEQSSKLLQDGDATKLWDDIHRSVAMDIAQIRDDLAHPRR